MNLDNPTTSPNDLMAIRAAERSASLFITSNNLNLGDLDIHQEKKFLRSWVSALKEALKVNHSTDDIKRSVAFGFLSNGGSISRVYDNKPSKEEVKRFLQESYSRACVFTSYTLPLGGEDLIKSLDGSTLYIYSSSYLGDESASTFDGVTESTLISEIA